MSTWHTSTRPGIEAWSSREKQDLVESGKSTRLVPMFRPFDLLAEPNQALTILSNHDNRIGIESVVGAQENFTRNIDFDTVYFQFAGTTSLETEFGEIEMAPGELLVIPEGIAHRSTGSADSLRWFIYARTPFTAFQADENHTSETSFTVTRHNGPDWKIEPGKERPIKEGRVNEVMVCWDDKPDDLTIIARDYGSLVGVSSLNPRESASGLRKLRAFDLFGGIAGTAKMDGPIIQSPTLEVKTYNIIGEQFAFHRALRSEEVRIQFRGRGLDMSELENMMVYPGRVTVIPRGIAHSVITDPPEDETFLRINFYSTLTWSYPADLTKHAFESTFEVETNVIRAAPWSTKA